MPKPPPDCAPPEELKDAALTAARLYLNEHQQTAAAVRELAAAGRLLVHLSRQDLILRLEKDQVLAEAEYATVGLNRQSKTIIATNPEGRRRVRPDILVHKRGNAGPNCLVLEIKLGTWAREPRSVPTNDRCKLMALTNPQEQYKYTLGLWLALPIGPCGRGHYAVFVSGQMQERIQAIP